MAIFGAGAQALPQVLAVLAVRPIERIWIVNRTRDRAGLLASRLRGEGYHGEVRIAPTVQQALADADIICTATSSATPLFADGAVRPGTHINGVGSFTAQMAEVPPETVARARVIVDQREPAWAEAGDLIQARDQGLIASNHVAGELGEVLAGKIAGRQNETEITFFKSVGNAIQDLAVAGLALTQAAAEGLGIEVAL